jgi:hypothetical protein
VEESNRQAEIQWKTQADARAQAETLRLAQEADDNVFLHENQNFPYAPNAYFNITSPDGFTFSKAMSPSFGGRAHVMNELVKSPQLVLDPLSSTESMAHSNPIAPTNMDTESTEYFIMSNSRRNSAENTSLVPQLRLVRQQCSNPSMRQQLRTDARLYLLSLIPLEGMTE